MSIQAYNPQLTFFERVGEALSSPYNAFEGSIWSVIVVAEGMSFISDVTERLNHAWMRLNGVGGMHETPGANKKLFKSSYSSLSGLTYFLAWANKVGIVYLGQWAQTVAGVGFFSRLLLSGSHCWDAVGEYNQANEEADAQKKTIALLKIASQASMVVWSILGLVTLAVAIPELVALFDAALMLSCVFFVVEIGYNYHLSKTQKNTTNPSSGAAQPTS